MFLAKQSVKDKDHFSDLQRTEVLEVEEYFSAGNLAAEPEVSAHLSRSEIDALCSLDIHFAHVDETFRKLGLEK